MTTAAIFYIKNLKQHAHMLTQCRFPWWHKCRHRNTITTRVEFQWIANRHYFQHVRHPDVRSRLQTVFEQQHNKYKCLQIYDRTTPNTDLCYNTEAIAIIMLPLALHNS